MSTEQHTATANLVDLVDALLAHGGWMTIQGLADKTGIHRDTVRRIVTELARRGWVARAEDDAGERWSLGPELPRIGLTWMEQIRARAALLRQEFDTLTADLVVGGRGEA